MSTFEEQKETFLSHYGVKGMRWGQRRAQKKYDKKVRKNFMNIHNSAADDVNSGKSPIIKKTNQKIDALLKKEGARTIDDITSEVGQSKLIDLFIEYDNNFSDLMATKTVEMFGERPGG